MKIEVALDKSSRLINSGQVILVSSALEEKKNIIPIAWNMPLSRLPSLLGISLAKTHFSSQLIKKSQEFIVNIPDVSLLDAVIYCGTHSGREIDKFKETGLTAVKAHYLRQTPIIKECIGHIECYLRDTKEIGDHLLFIGEVVGACAEESLFDQTWNPDKVKLIYHLGGRVFTTSGKKIEIK